MWTGQGPGQDRLAVGAGGKPRGQRSLGKEVYEAEWRQNRTGAGPNDVDTPYEQSNFWTRTNKDFPGHGILGNVFCKCSVK
jgi:hypothetical protein